MHHSIVFRPSNLQCECDALADIEIISNSLPPRCWKVTIVLGVRHQFFSANDSVEVSLGIIAYEHSEHENATFAEVCFRPEIFAYYPQVVTTFSATLEQLRNPDAYISALEKVLLERFVNHLVAATECALVIDEDTEDLTAELRLKESGALLVHTTFLRRPTLAG